MTFLHRADDGTETDITESVQALYDLVIGSMDWGSGFLTSEDAAPVVLVAELGKFPDAERVREYVNDRRQSEEVSEFLRAAYPEAVRRQYPHATDGEIQRAVTWREWARGKHDHTWSTVDRCLWPGCLAIRDASMHNGPA